MGERELSDLADLYVEYTPTVTGTPHPTSLVVTSTLRFATPPPSTDFLHHSILCNPAFSAPQLDAIALARQAHLKDRAFLLGDGTGVGKGRELAGMLMNHLLFHPSHRRFVFVTASAQLEADIVRDLGDIGWKSKGPSGIPVLSLQSFPPSHSIPVRRAILFMTYTLLRQPGTAKSKGKGAAKKSRLDQVLQWLDRGDGGMLVFDEIHAAKDIKTSTSQAVVALQDGAPKYKCAYASATACSSIVHLGTMVRLGLWGLGSAFETREAFFERWHSQTRSGLELVSAEMAAQGLYVARRLSFSGTDFAPVTVSMTPHDLDLHRRLCVWFLRVSKLPDCFVSRHQKARLWSSHLTFFKALLVAFRVRACAQLAKQAVDEGGSVVISLIGTGEAAAKRMIEEADDDVFEDGFVALQETLKTVIELAKCDGDGTVRSDFPVAVTELEKQIDTFELPPSPLDLLIHELTLLGHGAVAEMTGRVGGFYKDASINKWRYCKRTTTNLQECNKFQAGDAKFAVISSAASTGISLHNDINGPNRRRTQFMLELPWHAQVAMQQLGRTHRSAQHNAPRYVLLSSNLDAERRFAATVAKRAADLGAATTGDRRGANGGAFGSDVLIGPDATDGMRRLFSSLRNRYSWPVFVDATADWNDDGLSNPPMAGMVGPAGSDGAKQADGVAEPASSETDSNAHLARWQALAHEVSQSLSLLQLGPTSQPKQLLGRMLGLPFKESNNVMRLFHDAATEASLQSARNASDLGVEDVTITESGTTRVTDVSEGGLLTVATDIGIDFDSAVSRAAAWRAEHDDNPKKKVGFYTRYDNMRQRSFTVLALFDPPRVKLVRPNGRSATNHVAEFTDLYRRVNETQGKELWSAEFDLSRRQCSHGPKCKFANCRFGKRDTLSTLVKMAGATDALAQYSGSTQVVRLSHNEQTCVAVRLSSTSNALSAVESAVVHGNKQQALLEFKVAKAHNDTLTTLESAASGVGGVGGVGGTGGTTSKARVARVARKYSDSDSDSDSDGDSDSDSMERANDRVPATSSDESDESDESDDGATGPDRVAPPPKKRMSVKRTALQALLSELTSSDED